MILNILKEQPFLSIREIADQSGMSVHSVQHHINKLKETGEIRHVGPIIGMALKKPKPTWHLTSTTPFQERYS
jgi:DNA-binding Lrp family transcriptional regulator